MPPAWPRLYEPYVSPGPACMAPAWLRLYDPYGPPGPACMTLLPPPGPCLAPPVWPFLYGPSIVFLTLILFQELCVGGFAELKDYTKLSASCVI